ncbi:hypothetical protein FS749_000194 [Ceratobasidium sp. UAMH 11750]|nr:hypothetical protein FS749_000194 [Ceratobasidium sp. UAMH 11750]
MSHKDWDAVGWRKLDSNKNQQWYVQRSGEGYRIKNCSNGLYIAVDGTHERAKVFCGIYPVTWELRQESGDYSMYIIKHAGCDRVIDLDDWGKAHDGNGLHTFPQGGWLACKRWRFERLSDDTGEEEQKLSKELQSKNTQVAEKDRRIQEQGVQLAEKGGQLAERDRQLAERDQQLAEKDSQLAQMKERLASQGGELSRVKLDLAQKSELLLQTQDALRRAGESLAAQGNESLRDEVRSMNHRLEKAENLQERLETLEKMFAEVTSQNIMPRNITW